ncbi:MAG: hypothetical protein ACYC0V_17010 [Armatimonadota bacterium]
MTDEIRDEEHDDEEVLADRLKDLAETKGNGHVQIAVESAAEKLSQDQCSGVLKEILDALKERGFELNVINEYVALSSTDTRWMDLYDLGKVGGFISEYAPDLLPMLAEKIPGFKEQLGDSGGILGKVTGLFGKKE